MWPLLKVKLQNIASWLITFTFVCIDGGCNGGVCVLLKSSSANPQDGGMIHNSIIHN